jgi:hypothetical protein
MQVSRAILDTCKAPNSTSSKNLREIVLVNRDTSVLSPAVRRWIWRPSPVQPRNAWNARAVKLFLRFALERITKLNLRIHQKIARRPRESIGVTLVLLIFSLRWYIMQEMLFWVALTGALTMLVACPIALTLILEQPTRRAMEWAMARLGRIETLKRLQVSPRSKM